ncbi:MAG: chromate efflux transporter [Bacteroidota bacterium]|nr:chromate efflux transporter [Bacteroidota bacterium]
MQQISLFRLFLIFLKIGITSFGGNIALVAAVRKDLCERRKLLTDEQVLDFTTLGNILPGPLATNVISACGYAVRGLPGALLGLTGVILPALILICVLAEFYFRNGESETVLTVFGGLLAGVAAIITVTAWSLAKKSIKNPLQVFILVAAAAAIFLFKGFLVTLAIIFGAGLLGFLFFKTKPFDQNSPATSLQQKKRVRSFVPLAALITVVFTGLLLYLIIPGSVYLQNLRLLGLTFGSMSVTLFGGGYVFIPAIEKVVVGTHHWVTSREFADGIAMGQITPGPVAITASFVGYKISGIWGAVVSAIAIFFPPAILMLLAQQFIDRIKNKPGVESVFKGVRPAVIGMILASVWIIGKSAPQDWQSIVIFATILILSLWRNYDTIILIPIAGVMGFLLHMI